MNRSKALVALLFLPVVAFGTVGIQIRSGNFADESGIASSGMSYAIVVDTGGDGFLEGAYNSFDISSLGTGGGTYLQVGGVDTDDWYTFGSTLNETETGPPIAFLPGYADEVSDVPLSSSGSPITSGMTFAIIWFANDSATISSPYGFYEDSNLVLPSDSSIVNYSGFIGDDLKIASYTIAAVPEPQTYAFIVGLVGLVFAAQRRRR
ncbi:hypothetical protein [Cerasicoccus frondis]|uniref:hypothetical protein n=1 Tax=Cerasicoccus frondis TaxID=490090 RepID=UPI0028526772|nr:hypothetical protein [Cerasicoccus frondis]